MISESMNRRNFTRSGVASIALLAIGSHSAIASGIDSVDGIAGGGAMQAGEGPAEFSVFAVRFSTEDESTPQLAGGLQYLDVAAKTMIESISIIVFSPIEGQESTTRQLSGIATIDGSGAHPFDAILIDGGPIGSGGDSFELRVGRDGATTTDDPVYTVRSVIQAGNLQIISVSSPDSTEATPTPAG